jgi:hydrophobic/amphiphilic exporter-1 (mainly G- bacteria), HAE1 family
MVVSGLVLVGTIYLFYIIPKGFLPNEDMGQIFTSTEAQQGISFENLKQHQLALVDAVLKSPSGKYLGNFMTSIPSGTSNQGRMFMRMVPRSQRPPVDKIIQDLRPVVGSIPGLNVYLQNPPPIRIGGQLTKAQYQFTLQSPDQAQLYEYAPKLTDAIRKLPGLQDVNSDMLMKSPQVNINIDRDKAAALGLTAAQIEDALYTAYSQRQISTIYDPTNAFRVVMELEDQYQEDPSALSLLYIRSPKTFQLVPLNTVVTLTRSLGPLQVNHLGQLPAVTISFNLKPDVALGDAVDAVNQAARTRPDSITTSFQGTAAAFQSSFAGLGLLLAMAILVIYIVLGVLYESFIHPLTILSGLPAAGFGALLTLQFFRQPFWPMEWRVTDLNIYGFVGLIMLVGIVKKNAIMMIDFALEAQRKEGKSPADAIYEGALVRFRPIMMTTMAALMGTLPIALGMGAGAESRRPLGLAVVGGLMFSQVLTLYITPVVYTYMESFQGWTRRHFGKGRTLVPELEIESELTAQK